MKVIFVGGTAYSGSTLLDMTLANDPKAFSCGEVHALFRPFRPHHIRPLCGCENKDCEIWPTALAAGEEHLYETLFSLHPDLEFIVDSSKDPFWIARQSERLEQQGIETRQILIWKTPLELASSFKKRNQAQAWERNWVNYHRLYQTMVDDWRSIPYSEYTRDSALLERICSELDIAYFPDKRAYWQKTHHLLFGNRSARIHLGSDAEKMKTEPDSPAVLLADTITHQSIYYQPVEDLELEREVERTIQESSRITSLLVLLGGHDLRNATGHESRIDEAAARTRMGWHEVQLRRLKRAINFRLGSRAFSPPGSPVSAPREGAKASGRPPGT